jgi:hypothetical protein
MAFIDRGNQFLGLSPPARNVVTTIATPGSSSMTRSRCGAPWRRSAQEIVPTRGLRFVRP